MKKIALLISSVFLLMNGYAQVNPTPFDLSGQDGIPLYIYPVSTDTVWAGAIGMNSGTWINVKTYGRTVNSGTTWNMSAIPDPLDRGIIDFYALNGNMAWAVVGDFNGVNDEALWKTTDGGNTWTLTTELDAHLAAGFFLNSIYFFSPDSGIAMGDPRGGYAEVYNTSNGGSSWTRVPQANIPPAALNEFGVLHGYTANGNRIWFTGSNDKIYYSFDRGYTWGVTPVLSGGYYHGIAFTDDLNGVAFIDNNASPTSNIYVTTDGGETWIDQTLLSITALLQVSEVKNTPGTFVFTANAPPKLYATTDNFATSFLIDQAYSYADAPYASPIKMFNSGLGWAAASPASANAIYKLGNVLSGINDISNASNINAFQIFPNPVTAGAALTSFTLHNNAKVNLSLFDVSGKLIASKSANGIKGANAQIFDFTNVSSGLYTLNVKTKHESATIKVIVQ